jgi:hypothetical protein
MIFKQHLTCTTPTKIESKRPNQAPEPTAPSAVAHLERSAQSSLTLMNIPLRQRWALFVIRYSRPKAWLYFCLILTLALGAVQFKKYVRIHFLLVMIVPTLMAFERLALAELFATQQRRIEALENRENA